MRKWVYTAIATAGGLGLLLAIVLATGVVRLGGTPRCSRVASRPGEGPLVGGKTTSVAGAQSIARFPVLTPDVGAARLSNLTQTWVNKERNVALVFAHGKVTITFAPAMYRSALKEFQRFIAQNHVTAAISHVHRDPALASTPHTDGCRSNPAWVEFKRSGIDINVYSASYGTDMLLSIADSLRQRTAWHPARQVS
jgi:hypothetical protein